MLLFYAQSSDALSQVQKKPVDEVDNVFQDADFPRHYKIKK